MAQFAAVASSEASFFKALVNSSVSNLFVTQNIKLQHAFWQAQPGFHITRDLVVQGASRAVELDLHFVKDKAVLDAGVTLTFRNITLVNVFSAMEHEYDFLVPSHPSSAVVWQDVVAHLILCMPLDYTSASWAAEPRPADAPGIQDVSVDSSAPFCCCRGAGSSDRCFSPVLKGRNLVTASGAGYRIEWQRTTTVCEGYATQACIDGLGREICFANTLQELLAERAARDAAAAKAVATASATAPESDGGLSDGAKVGIIVGSVVAAASVLLLAGSVAWVAVVRRRRRRAADTSQQARQQQFASGPHKSATSNSSLNSIGRSLGVSGKQASVGAALVDTANVSLCGEKGGGGSAPRSAATVVTSGVGGGGDAAVALLVDGNGNSATALSTGAGTLVSGPGVASVQRAAAVRAAAAAGGGGSGGAAAWVGDELLVNQVLAAAVAAGTSSTAGTCTAAMESRPWSTPALGHSALTSVASGGGGSVAAFPGASDLATAAAAAGQDVMLGQLIGSGSFGKVYRGTWRGACVAVKVISHNRLNTLAAIANELRLSLSFENRNVVRALSYITCSVDDEGRPTLTVQSRDVLLAAAARGVAAAVKAAAASDAAAGGAGSASAAAWGSGAGGAGSGGYPAAASGLVMVADATLSTLGLDDCSTLPRGESAAGASGAGGGRPGLLSMYEEAAAANAGGGGGAEAVRGGGGGGNGLGPPGDTALGCPLPRDVAETWVIQEFMGRGTLATYLRLGGLTARPGIGGGGSTAASATASVAGSRVGAGAAATSAAHSPQVSGRRQSSLGLPLKPVAEAVLEAAAEGTAGCSASGTAAVPAAASRSPPASTAAACVQLPSASAPLPQPPQPDMLRVVCCALDCARGLEYLHTRNVCHGDLKPGNILLADDPSSPWGMVAKLADFGLSRALAADRTHMTTNTVGTVPYMCPVVLGTGKVSPSSCIYSFGIIMWELVSGIPPFFGWVAGHVIKRVMLEDARPDFGGLPGVPTWYIALAEGCWDKDPAVRPSMAQVVRELEGRVESMRGGGVSNPVELAAPELLHS